ncbi:MAG: UMP kinase [Oscillospiraceae bacterium]|nr:UMP kinase [Oscillospiraceae bacterium]
MLKYKRILLKLSGEALAGDRHFGIDPKTLESFCKAIKETADLGTEIGIVVGGGNFWRGRDAAGMERTRADHIGMLATVMNGLAVAEGLEKQGATVRVMTAIPMQNVAEPYIRNRAIRHLEKGRIIILSGGTGNPYFSTDSAAALRAAEIGAEAVLKATMVDGVYNKDPHKYEDAVRYSTVTFTKVLADNLNVIDSTAASMCRDNNIPVLVFDLQSDPQNLVRVVKGEDIGTLIKED